MRRHPFGRTERSIPPIGQGTWNLERADRDEAVATLRRGLDLGMTHLDTAEMYGSGAAEELVGEAIAGRRAEVFLVTKVLPHNASRAGTRAACERSLTRMRTDRLDCYLLHWRGSHPLSETVAAFDDLRRAGRILSWGVSNFDVEDLEELRSVTGSDGPACNQVLYHVQERAIEHAVLPWCEAHGIAVVAYSPFGHDRFPSSRSAGGRVLPWCERHGVAVTAYSPFGQDAFPPPTSAGGRALAAIASARAATPRQVALAFLTRRPAVFAIPKASSVAHVVENAAAGDLRLTAAEIAQIEAAFPLGRRPRSLPML